MTWPAGPTTATGSAAATSEQLGFSGMPRRLVQAAPARLLSYLDCPRRYRFTYLDRPPPPKGPPWAHNSLGAAVHTALANWWKVPPDRRTGSTAADLVDEAWLREGFRDDAQCESARRRPARWCAGTSSGWTRPSSRSESSGLSP